MQFKLTIGFFMLLSALTLTGCGMHYMVDGQVVDAVTRQPVEGAVVAVKWVRYKPTPPGLPTNKERYGTSEAVTDSQGQFTIPKYTFGSHFMGVYKAGYICWSSETIYNPEGKTYKEKYAYRKSHQVEDGMIIELMPISGKDFPELEHAKFVSSVRSQVSGPKFYNATAHERELESKHKLNRWGKTK